MTEQLDASYLIEVRGDEVLRIRDDLDDAVNRAVNHAIKIGRHGVLITQRSYTPVMSRCPGRRMPAIEREPTQEMPNSFGSSPRKSTT